MLKEAAASHPELPPGRLMFAKLCLKMDQPAKGRDALELTAVENPEVPHTYIVFGWLALQDNRLTDALLQFEKAIGLAASGSWSDPLRKCFLSDAYSGLAGVAEKRKDWPAAATSLAAWLKLEPKSGQARGRLAEALFHQGQYARAQGEFEQAVRDDPTLGSAAILTARLFTEEGNLAKAGEWMEHAVKVAPDNAKTHLGYASWLLERGRNKQAKAEAETAARIDPASEDAKSLDRRDRVAVEGIPGCRTDPPGSPPGEPGQLRREQPLGPLLGRAALLRPADARLASGSDQRQTLSQLR